MRNNKVDTIVEIDDWSYRMQGYYHPGRKRPLGLSVDDDFEDEPDEFTMVSKSVVTRGMGSTPTTDELCFAVCAQLRAE